MPMQIRRTATVNLPPTGLAEGQLGVEMAGPQAKLWVGVPVAIDASGRRLLVPSGTISGTTPPATPAAGDLFFDTSTNQLLYYDGSNWLPATPDAPVDGLLYARRDGQWSVLNIPDVPDDVSILPVGGRLVLNGASPATTLRLIPFRGEWIRIAGQYYPIPPAGIVSPAASTVTNNTFYYVYLYDNAGVLAIEFSTTTHQSSTTPGNIGTEIKQGDDSRTLIGCCYVTVAQFLDNLTNRNVRSWLNRPTVSMNGGFSNANFGGTITFLNVFCVAWNQENLQATGNGNFAGTGGTPANLITIFLQRNGVGWGSSAASTYGGWNNNVVTTAAAAVNEGRQTITVQIQSANGNAGGSGYVLAMLME